MRKSLHSSKLTEGEKTWHEHDQRKITTPFNLTSSVGKEVRRSYRSFLLSSVPCTLVAGSKSVSAWEFFLCHWIENCAVAVHYRALKFSVFCEFKISFCPGFCRWSLRSDLATEVILSLCQYSQLVLLLYSHDRHASSCLVAMPATPTFKLNYFPCWALFFNFKVHLRCCIQNYFCHWRPSSELFCCWIPRSWFLSLIPSLWTILSL